MSISETIQLISPIATGIIGLVLKLGLNEIKILQAADKAELLKNQNIIKDHLTSEQNKIKDELKQEQTTIRAELSAHNGLLAQQIAVHVATDELRFKALEEKK